jgi:hypothetical protein
MGDRKSHDLARNLNTEMESESQAWRLRDPAEMLHGARESTSVWRGCDGRAAPRSDNGGARGVLSKESDGEVVLSETRMHTLSLTIICPVASRGVLALRDISRASQSTINTSGPVFRPMRRPQARRKPMIQSILAAFVIRSLP